MSQLISILKNKNKLSHPTNMGTSAAYFSEMDSALISPASQLFAENISKLQISPSPSTFKSFKQNQNLKDLLFDATANVKILTSQVAMHMEKSCRENLFKQIDLLHKMDEWEIEDKPVNKASFSTFLKAMLSIKPTRLPGLGLNFEGFLIAAWNVNKDRLIVEFQPNDKVRLVLSRHLDEEIERTSSQTTVSRLFECLAPYNPAYWFFNEEDK